VSGSDSDKSVAVSEPPFRTLTEIRAWDTLIALI
jgi:hypothetical protein